MAVKEQIKTKIYGNKAQVLETEKYANHKGLLIWSTSKNLDELKEIFDVANCLIIMQKDCENDINIISTEFKKATLMFFL